MPSAFFIGLGYSAHPLAEELIRAGWEVVATTRSEDKAKALAAQGMRAVLWESGHPLNPAEVAKHRAVIVSVAPADGQCPVANALGELPTDCSTRFLYLSSSGVYGDHDGKWVDEAAACHPSTERGIARLHAEQQWQELVAGRGAELSLCRLAGIYGPGRSAVDSLSGNTPGARAGLSRRLMKPGHVFNRIHRDDIARGLRALLDAPSPPDIINFSDDEPSASADVVAYAAELLGIDPPPQEQFDDVVSELSPMAQSFYAENKRLRNDCLKRLIGDLLYPTYREGLRAIHAGLQPRK